MPDLSFTMVSRSNPIASATDDLRDGIPPLRSLVNEYTDSFSRSPSGALPRTCSPSLIMESFRSVMWSWILPRSFSKSSTDTSSGMPISPSISAFLAASNISETIAVLCSPFALGFFRNSCRGPSTASSSS